MRSRSLTTALDDDIVVLVNRKVRAEKRSRQSGNRSWTDEGPPLTRSQIRELQRRVRDLEDRTRYLLASVFTRRFVLYYDVSQDTYVTNDPALGTLFKRRAAAEAVRQLLSPNVRVLRCRVDRRNRLVKSSVPSVSPTFRRARPRAVAPRHA